MRIGIDARPLAKRRTGIGNYVFNVLKELKEIDSENEYFLYSNKAFSLPFEEDERWHKCIYPSRIGTLWYCICLPQILRKDGIDTFWGTQHVLPFGNRSIMYLLTVHDLAMYYFPKAAAGYNYIVNRLLLPYSVHKADNIIAVSISTQNDLINKLGTDERKISVIYEAADKRFMPADIASAKKKAAAKYGINEDYILYLGTLEPRKNVPLLLEAYKKYMDMNLSGHRLVLAGGRGWKYEEIFRLADRLDLSKKVIFPGYVEDEDLTDLYSAASLFVFPSKYEGFGLPVLEAMSCSIPVITSNVSSLPEVAGQAAILTDPEDPDMLAANIRSVLTDEKLQMELKAKGIRQSGKFSWQDCAMGVYRLLMETGASGGGCRWR